MATAKTQSLKRFYTSCKFSWKGCQVAKDVESRLSTRLSYTIIHKSLTRSLKLSKQKVLARPNNDINKNMNIGSQPIKDKLSAMSVNSTAFRDHSSSDQVTVHKKAEARRKYIFPPDELSNLREQFVDMPERFESM